MLFSFKASVSRSFEECVRGREGGKGGEGGSNGMQNSVEISIWHFRNFQAVRKTGCIFFVPFPRAIKKKEVRRTEMSLTITSKVGK